MDATAHRLSDRPAALGAVTSRGGVSFRICTKAPYGQVLNLALLATVFIILSIIPFVALKINLDVN